MNQSYIEHEGVKRCRWCGTDPLYMNYHDEEWGKEVNDDNLMFEFLVLESAQAGLSWITVLRKREAYREAFAGFDAKKVSQFDDKKIEELLKNEGIIRNKLKIKAAISNAKLFLAIQKEFGSFCAYLKSFLPNGKPIINHWESIDQIPTSTAISDAISSDMKKRGFKFFGTTICYAHLQAVGYINDHLIDCHCRRQTIE